MLERLIAPVPSWRMLLYVVAGVGVGFLAGRAASGLAGHGAQMEVTASEHTREEAQGSKNVATVTRTVERPVLLSVPDGGVLLATERTTDTSTRSAEEWAASLKSDSTTVTKPSDKPWRVGAKVGATWGAPIGSNPLVVGAEAAFAIPKTPFEVGAWVTVPLYDPTRGAAGGSVSFRW